MSEEKSRRRFIATTGAVGGALLAGCTELGVSDGDGMETKDGMDETEMGNGMDGTEMNETEMDDGMDEETDEEMDDGMETTDPAEAPRAEIDRFSESAGTLMVRSMENSLPGPDEPIDFDQGPFVTRGLGPDGEHVTYYNFDVQPTAPAPIYVLFKEGEDGPVEGQLNIVGTIPGDEGYNDFWQVHEVTVPAEYEANTATSVEDIENAGYEIEATDVVKNCPVVPNGSTASMRYNDGETKLVEGWYDGQVVSYFLFEEAPLELTDDSVPVSPIYVSFNENPGEEGGGPPSGFRTEMESERTHNVVATLPGDDSYSPLWSVNVYDNADFEIVSDLDSATDATILAEGDTTVNCPIVSAGMDG